MKGATYIILACLLLFLTGCVSTNANRSYGTLSQNRAVELSFKKFQIPEGYNYYYSGRANIPDAIVGIKDGYLMAESKFWHPVDLDEEKMREWWGWIENSWYDPIGRSYERYGSATLGWVITAPAGEQVGVMYAKFSRVTVFFVDENVLSFSVPRQRGERRLWPRYDD